MLSREISYKKQTLLLSKPLLQVDKIKLLSMQKKISGYNFLYQWAREEGRDIF